MWLKLSDEFVNMDNVYRVILHKEEVTLYFPVSGDGIQGVIPDRADYEGEDMKIILDYLRKNSHKA